MNKTKISWTDCTHNFWNGCHKVSAGCKYCYMHRLNERFGKDLDTVRLASDKYFYAQLRVKTPLVIFTYSMSDFLIEDAEARRADAWRVIKETPQHTWQILTKRPERIAQCLPADWGENGNPNVWLGVSVENNEYLYRMETLAKIPAAIRFVSGEPLLENVDFLFNNEQGERPIDSFQWETLGGESGNKVGKYRFRPRRLEWLTKVIADLKECTATAVFVKQLGTFLASELGVKDQHGTDIDEFPDQLKVQEMPKISLALAA